MVWLNGSLNARGWEHVVPVSLALLVLVPAALLLDEPTTFLDLAHQIDTLSPRRSGPARAAIPGTAPTSRPAGSDSLRPDSPRSVGSPRPQP